MKPDAQTLIVAAAPAAHAASFYTTLITGAPYVIAVDGGVALCLAAGRNPDVCIGDFDSAAPGDLELARSSGSVVITHPAEKDESDLDLALAHARGAGLGPVTVTAAFSGRVDHTIAALGALLSAADLPSVGVEPDAVYHVLDARVRPELRLDLPIGTTLSAFAADPQTVVTLEGVRYPLTSEPLELWTSRGLSNLATAGTQTLHVHEGRLLVIVDLHDR